MSRQLDRGAIGPLKALLSEAARTDEQNAESVIGRYVELRPGMRGQLLSKRHHLVSGRRGTGKSTLLHVMRSDVQRTGTRVATVDMERFKGRAYPDVLIEILKALLSELKPHLNYRTLLASLRLRRRHRTVISELGTLLANPQVLQRTLQRKTTQLRKHGADTALHLSTGLATRYVNARGEAGAKAGTAVTHDTELSDSATFTVLKIELLQEVAPRIASLLADLVKASGSDFSLVFVDDFYYAQLDDQPFVLDYLHQVCKSTGAWLKIGGVGSRMRPYRDGNPPTGMQPDQDIDRLSMDVSLEEFIMAKDFLERVMNKLLESMDLDVGTIFTDGARDRIVLACGGAVPRDYMTLTSSALDSAVQRQAKGERGDVAFRIQAEDVQEAARRRLSQKVEELDDDAGSDASSLRVRWEDILEFSQQHIKAQFILVEGANLAREPWGEQILQLENLRLLHRIRESTPNTASGRGRRVVVYMLDLAAQAEKRVQRKIPEFWKGEREFDKLRRARWVYTPQWRTTAAIAEDEASDVTEDEIQREWDLFEADATDE